MKTQEQITVSGAVPIGTWDDLPARQAAWAALREQAAGMAARDGKVLTGTPGTRQFLYMRTADPPGGEPADVETTRDHAEFVRLRLSCWTEKR